MNPFNLLTENWIPVRRADGSRSCIPPWRITDPDPAIVDIDAPRPDFKGALLELLIGLVQTALPPKNDADWLQGFATPPKPDTLQKAFAPLIPFFNLFGDRPCFLQDLTLTEAEAKTPSPIAALLMGFCFEDQSVVVESAVQRRFWRGGKEAKITTLDFAGFASVADPGKALRALLAGVGPAKGFGCGLLLARRA